MEGNGLTTRMYANMGGRVLGLDMPLQSQNQLQKQSQIMGFPQQQQNDQTQLSIKQPNYLYNNNPDPNPPQKPKIQSIQITNSDDDEPNDQENSSSDLKKKSCNNSNNVSMSPWQRMKWTDNMVRLLIMAVYYIGDEAGGTEIGPEKKKPGCGGGVGGGGALQKKGKWKSVSKAMMEKGFYVSPQQCEDKFNDLNKRYKRVNDILGRGTACNVVEDQNLLETMRIEPKLKEEVKKLLNSKHLFFREMCAYHNSCGHGGNNNTTGGETGMVGPTHQPAQHYQPQSSPPHRQLSASSCLHSGQMQHPTLAHNSNSLEGVDDDEDEDDEDEDDEVEDHEEGGVSRKRARTTMQGVLSNGAKGGLDQWSGQVMGIFEDWSKSSQEKKHWVMTQMVELEENGVKIQREALELGKERLKWMKFSSKKEREMQRMRIDNEKKRLENERMFLLLRRKEIEFLSVDKH